MPTSDRRPVAASAPLPTRVPAPGFAPRFAARFAAPCAVVFMFLLVLATLGCQTTMAPHRPNAIPEPGRLPQPPTIGEATRRYNDNAAKLGRLWTRADVELSWTQTDDDGRTRRREESGSGKLMWDRAVPGIALTVSKLSNTLTWAGADARRYWLFDLYHEPTLLYEGRHDWPMDPRLFPLGINPRDLVVLLGADPIDPEAVDPLTGQRGRVSWHPSGWIVEPVAWRSGEAGAGERELDGDGDADRAATGVSAGYGARVRMLISEQTGLATRVDLVDREGHSLLKCVLRNYEPVELDGVPRQAWPMIATWVEIDTLPQSGLEPGGLRLALDEPTDGRKFDRITPQAFDLALLKRVHKPKRVVDVNRW